MPCCLYRRNDPLVIAELRAYCLDMAEAEKRMEVWVKNAAGQVVPADRQRAEDENIDNGKAYPFKTYYGAQGEHGVPIPHPVQCTKGEHSCAILASSVHVCKFTKHDCKTHQLI